MRKRNNSRSSPIFSCSLVSCCRFVLFPVIFLMFYLAYSLFIKVMPSTPTNLLNAFTSARIRIYRRWQNDALSRTSLTLESVDFKSIDDIIKSHIYAFIPISQAHSLVHTKESSLKHDKFNFNSGNYSNRILCSVFMRANEKSLELLVQNIGNLNTMCSWAIISFSGDQELFFKYQKIIMNIKHVDLVLYKFALSRLDLIRKIDPKHSEDYIDGVLKYNPFSYPKTAMYEELLPFLPYFKYVWLLDDDMDVSKFSLRKYIKTMTCSFWPSQPPLISQPLIRQAPDSFTSSVEKKKLRHQLPLPPNPSFSASISKPLPRYEYLQHEAWKLKSNSNIEKLNITEEEEQKRKELSEVLMVRTDFLEMQVPLLNTGFFAWFINKVTNPTLIAANILGADYGYDNIFCQAASVFAERLTEVLSSEHNLFDNFTSSFSSSDNSKVKIRYSNPCAIVIGGNSVIHRDRKSSSAHMSPEDRRALNLRMVRVLRRSFPTWFINGFEKRIDPRYNTKTYARSTYLSGQCSQPK